MAEAHSGRRRSRACDGYRRLGGIDTQHRSGARFVRKYRRVSAVSTPDVHDPSPSHIRGGQNHVAEATVRAHRAEPIASGVLVAPERVDVALEGTVLRAAHRFASWRSSRRSIMLSTMYRGRCFNSSYMCRRYSARIAKQTSWTLPRNIVISSSVMKPVGAARPAPK